MMPKRSNNRRRRQNRNGGNSIRIQSTTTLLPGKEVLAQINTTGAGFVSINVTNLNPLLFNDRVAQVAAAFNRFRIRKLVFTFKSRLASVYSGKLFFGVSDDPDVVATPSTGDQVLNLRSSRETAIWKTASVSYSPIDRSKWYYIRAEGSGGDVRLTSTGAFYFISDASAITVNGTAITAVTLVGDMQVEYLYEFDGATVLAN